MSSERRVERPFSEIDWRAWDAACGRAQRSRGLGLEALSRSLPLGWRAGSIVAAWRESGALAGAAARSAAPALQDAFGSPAPALAFVEPQPGDDVDACWGARQAALLAAARRQGLEAFEREPLARALAAGFGARILPESFNPSDGAEP